MIKFKWVHVVLAGVLALAGCGGGGNAGTSPFGGGGGGATAVADLSLVLSENSIDNGGSDTVTVTVTAVDANRVAVPNATVTIGADNGAVVVADAGVTDASGKVVATVSNGTDKSNRTITVTATSNGLTRTANFQVTGANIQATGTTVVAPGAAERITFRLTDAATQGIAGASITVDAAGLGTVTGTTDSAGEYVYNYTAPTTAGVVNVQATAAGASRTHAVTVQAGGSTTIPPATAGSVTSASVAVSPSVVATGGKRAEVRALFLGANNAAVQNIRVRFDLAGDANSVGGTISSGSDIVYSDANGVATSAYVSGTRASPTDGVTIRACWDYTDFAAGTCPNSATKTLTVTSDALSVTIGFDNRISEGPSGLTYIKRFVVLVNDAAGQAKADVTITPSVDLVTYRLGYYVNPGAWTIASGRGQECANEDLNRNGVIESVEDFNANGQLDPRKADVLITMVGSNKTDSNGTAVMQIEYPKNVATWIRYTILVSASAVSGTEGRASVTKILEGLSSEFTAQEAPSFATSPYGTGTGTPTSYTPPGSSTAITVCTSTN